MAYICQSCNDNSLIRRFHSKIKCHKCYMKEWRTKNKKHVEEYKKNYRLNNPWQRKGESQLRKKRIKRAFLYKHIEKNDIKQFYQKCPEGYVVDHIVPLLHSEVCGLHVLNNLQYLSETENNIKNNHWDGTEQNQGWKKCLEF